MDEEVLITAAFPIADKAMIDKDINSDMLFVQESITAIRNLRKQLNLAPGLEISLVVRYAEDRQQSLFTRYMAYFKRLAKVSEITGGIGIDKPKAAIGAVVQNLEIFLPLSGLIDLESEKARLGKQIEKLSKELAGISAKLNNANFLAHAKEEVVAKEKEKYTEVNTKLSLTKDLLSDLQ